MNEIAELPERVVIAREQHRCAHVDGRRRCQRIATYFAAGFYHCDEHYDEGLRFQAALAGACAAATVKPAALGTIRRMGLT